jgi:hypothetical protein
MVGDVVVTTLTSQTLPLLQKFQRILTNPNVKMPLQGYLLRLQWLGDGTVAD